MLRRNGIFRIKLNDNSRSASALLSFCSLAIFFFLDKNISYDIEEYAFWNFASLTSITIPDSVKSISDYAFSNCTFLEYVIIPDSVTSIETYAFDGANLENIYYSGTMEEWNAIDKEVSLCGTYYTVHCSNGNIEE